VFLLDTNVLSEIRKGRRAEPAVTAWFESTPAELMYISPIVIAELEIGINLIARRDEVQAALLRKWVSGVDAEFKDRCVPIGAETARIFATLHVPDKRPERDAWIAATAIQTNMTVVTRNTSDFETTGVSLLDPWHNT
jgi:toxin FitB